MFGKKEFANLFTRFFFNATPSNNVDRVERKTEYPYGGSDYAVSSDERGKVTIRREDIVEGGI